MTKPTIRPPEGWDVDGADAIAAVLNVSLDELAQLRKRGGNAPPISIYLKRPIARRRDLEAWLRDERRRASR